MSDQGRTFWQGRRVLVTGHTGFKGSWLCLWLTSLQADVPGYALQPPTEPSLFEMAHVADGMDSILADIRDPDRLIDVVQQAAPSVVIHMAAQALVRESYRDPVGTYATNVLGTVNILEAVRQCESVRAVVVVTSDKCYHNSADGRPLSEADPMGGREPYSSSKGCAELATAAYRRSFFSAADSAAIASARSGNVIGGGDWALDRLIPDCVRDIAAGQTIHIRNPDAVRPWQHVLEPLGGYLRLAQCLHEGGHEYAEAWNFGPSDNDALPVRQVVDRLTKRFGLDARWERDRAEHPHEEPLLRLDCAKATDRLGWRPSLDLDEALDWTIDWYRGQQAGQDARQLCRGQIEQYAGRMEAP